MYSFGEGRHHGPHEFVGVGLCALLLGLQLQQTVDPLHPQVVLVVLERGERVLQHVGRVGEEDQGEDALVHAVRVVDPLLQDGVLDLLDQALRATTILSIKRFFTFN